MKSTTSPKCSLIKAFSSAVQSWTVVSDETGGTSLLETGVTLEMFSLEATGLETAALEVAALESTLVEEAVFGSPHEVKKKAERTNKAANFFINNSLLLQPNRLKEVSKFSKE